MRVYRLTFILFFISLPSPHSLSFTNIKKQQTANVWCVLRWSLIGWRHSQVTGPGDAPANEKRVTNGNRNLTSRGRGLCPSVCLGGSVCFLIDMFIYRLGPWSNPLLAGPDYKKNQRIWKIFIGIYRKFQVDMPSDKKSNPYGKPTLWDLPGKK